MDTPKKSLNTISGKIVDIENGVYVINEQKLRRWHIPKALRRVKVRAGDFVYARNSEKKLDLILVYNVYRENIEDTGRSYPSIAAKVKKSQKIALGAPAENNDKKQ